jgi:formylglycine-generating enzyme required for sulfatase activity
MRRAPAFSLVVLGALGCALASPACGARQWEVVISTNAALPRMGDRLHVDVLDENGNLACTECSRDLEASTIGERIKTFGIGPTDSAVRIRVRLFRYVSQVKKNDARVVDVVARLPELSGSDSIMSVEFPVPAECLGVAPDLANGITCRRDENGNVSIGPEPTLGGTGRLDPAPSGACAKAPPAGMACIGWGTYVMGDERIDALSFDFPSRPESVQRIAPASALMLDIDETTVGEVRTLVRGGKLDAALVSRGLVLHGELDTREEACTWRGVDTDRNDEQPINCVSRELARAVCAAKGRRLPFEHEWEFAAGNAAEQTLYPWGTSSFDDNLYDIAKVVENVPFGICEKSNVANGRSAFGESTTCARGLPPGPRSGGNNLDVTTQGVKNLGGNVAEWVDGDLALYDEECWSKPLAAPCRTPSKRLAGSLAPYRGGSWGRAPHAAFTVARFGERDGAPSPYIGFRCATTEAEMP